MSKKTFNFESAYKRLEEILEKMNESDVPIETSIALYEEAHNLMQQCSEFLGSAQKKVEILMKNKDKELIIDENGQPATEEFTMNHDQLLGRNIEN